MDKEKLNRLINQTRLILNHQKEKEILKGEKFNVFSILKMERKENATHSAFLKELLSPEGSHLKGDIFLKLFLKVIEDKTLDVESCKVKVEHFIGKLDVEAKTGGRIDIFIWDKNGKSISMENKIDAKDQDAQIERYYNYKTSTNKVYYLTLKGNDTSEKSRGNLVAGKDYFTLSYKEDITEWLQLCLKESAENPILRESIKQYILLLNKITYSMNNDEIYKLIIDNNEEASIIANNYNDAVWELSRGVRQEVIDLLISRIGQKYKIYSGRKVSEGYSHIWIKISGKDELKLFFGIQSFSIPKNGFVESLYVGIFVNEGKYIEDYKELGEKKSDYWINIEDIPDYKGSSSKIADPETMKRLGSEKEFRKGFIDNIVEHVVKYVNDNYDIVSSHLEDN